MNKIIRHRPRTDTRRYKNTCRICEKDTFTVMDLGIHPFANAFPPSPQTPIKQYPLQLLVCKNCSAAQLSYCANDKDLYSNYNYITPDSQMLQKHYAEIYAFLKKNKYINAQAHMLEIGSNIGQFLEFMKPYVRSIVGVDPAVNISAMANKKGIPTINNFFNIHNAQRILQQQGNKDFIVARHCFAHNEKPWFMLEGIPTLLAPDGIFLIENAYFLDTVMHREFDQIYHEHMYYYNVRSIQEILKKHDLALIDTMHSQIHGGTMVYIVKHKNKMRRLSQRATAYLKKEKDMHTPEFYKDFIHSVKHNKKKLVRLLSTLRKKGNSVHAYGACAKSTTLLNYYGITSKDVPYIVDSTPTKQGKFIPKARIKIISEKASQENPPDYYLLTIWNYKKEIMQKVRGWGNKKTKFILPHPEVKIIN